MERDPGCKRKSIFQGSVLSKINYILGFMGVLCGAGCTFATQIQSQSFRIIQRTLDIQVMI